MTSRETRVANAAAKDAGTQWRGHVRQCAGCRPAGPLATCATGLRLWRAKGESARELAEGRGADAQEIPGQVTLW
jgi:hypothetical protein